MDKILLLTKDKNKSSIFDQLNYLKQNQLIDYQCLFSGEINKKDLKWADTVIFDNSVTIQEARASQYLADSFTKLVYVLEEDLLDESSNLDKNELINIKTMWMNCSVLLTSSKDLFDKYGSLFDEVYLIENELTKDYFYQFLGYIHSFKQVGQETSIFYHSFKHKIKMLGLGVLQSIRDFKQYKTFNQLIIKSIQFDSKRRQFNEFDNKQIKLNDNSILIVDVENKDNVGGTSYYIRNYIDGLKKQGREVYLLTYKPFTSDFKLSNGVNGSVLKENIKLEELNKIFGEYLFSKLFINNLAYYPSPENFIDEIVREKNEYHFLLEYVFHDHLAACPSYFLIDYNTLPCRGNNACQCGKCFQNNKYRTMVRENLCGWRIKFNKLLNNVDEITFFSNYTKGIIVPIFPSAMKGIVEAHECLMKDSYSRYTHKHEKGNKTFNIGFVGNYCVEKGSMYFEELIKRLKKEFDINAYIIGPDLVGHSKDIQCLGRYDRADLGKILTDNKIDLVVYPSIANETYSYVADELMWLNMPFVCFACGAQAERIKDRNYEKCVIVDKTNEESLCNSIIRIINSVNIE